MRSAAEVQGFLCSHRVSTTDTDERPAVQSTDLVLLSEECDGEEDPPGLAHSHFSGHRYRLLRLAPPLSLLLIMFSSKASSSSPKYASLALHDHEDNYVASSEKRSSSSEGEDQSSPLLETLDDLPAFAPSNFINLSKLILCFSVALAMLSTTNIALLPTTLSKYQAFPFSDSELEALPYGDARLGLDRAAKMTPPPPVFNHAWPDRLARVSRKLQNAVWGQGEQVYITVEVRTPH